MAVKGLHYFVVITFLVKSSKSTDRQCHNETGRCFWLGTGSKTWEAARTACQSKAEISLSWKLRNYMIS